MHSSLRMSLGAFIALRGWWLFPLMCVSGISRVYAQQTAARGGYVSTPDSVRLYYEQIGRGKPLVIYVHGGPGSNFRGQDEYLAPLARGRRIVFYDQRGSGRSEVVTDAGRLTAADHVRDLEALRRHLRAPQLSLIGLSWGAGLAALYASEFPARVTRLVLISPMPPTRRLLEARSLHIDSVLGAAAVARRRTLRDSLASAPDSAVPRLCRAYSDVVFHVYLAEPTAAKLDHARRRCNIPAAAIRNRFRVESATVTSLGAWDFRSLLGRLQIPALVLEGAATQVPLDATRVWAAALPKAYLLLIGGAGHELFLDAPAQFQAAVQSFLEGGIPAGATRVQADSGT